MLDGSSKEDILVYFAPFWQHDEGRLLPKRRITRGEKQTKKKRIRNVSGLIVKKGQQRYTCPPGLCSDNTEWSESQLAI